MLEVIRGRLSNAKLALFALGVSALGALALSAGSAQAEEPFHLHFNQGELQVPGGVSLPLMNLQQPNAFDGEIDPATGDFTIPVDGITPPLFINGALTSPGVPEVQEPVTGTFDDSTGELQMSMVVNLHLRTGCGVFGGCDEVCTAEDAQLDLSTSNVYGSLQGAPFVDGLEGAGALVASWEELPASGPYPQYCEGPGGMVLKRQMGHVPLSVKPGTMRLKRGEADTFAVRVKNTTPSYLIDVKLCVKAPEDAIRVGGCEYIGNIPNGQPLTKEVKVKALHTAIPKRYPLRFKATATGDGPAEGHGQSTLKVRRAL